MHETPVQPDHSAISGNYRLGSNPVRL
ncbi:replication initiation protein, partial [Salmonella enterica subsp. enterica serovar Hadar]